jgi:hypothetical protein
MRTEVASSHAPAVAGGSEMPAVLAVAAQARSRLPWLWWGGWAMLVISWPLWLLMQVDERTLQGVNVWVKPWKFHVSAGVHLLTLAWCAALLRPTPRRARGFGAMSAVVLATAVFELAYITWRAARGEASHFNVGDPLAGAMYTLMGVMAVLLLGAAGVLGWWIWRARDFEHGLVLQRGLGLALMAGWLLGTVAGAYMGGQGGQGGHGVGVQPHDAQAAAAHALPIVGWLRGGGDLRVAHFFGMHAMHVLGAAAWAAAWWAARRASPQPAVSSGAVLTGLYVLAAVYAGFTVFTFVQAVAGQPFL